MIFFAFSLSTQHTILSGVIKSFIATHSFKNSGLETTSKPTSIHLFLSSSCIIFLHISPVPTGTVDLLINTLYSFKCCQKVCATIFTNLRSAL